MGKFALLICKQRPAQGPWHSPAQLTQCRASRSLNRKDFWGFFHRVYNFRYDSGYGTSPCPSGYHSGWSGNSYQGYHNHYNTTPTAAAQPSYLNPTPSVVFYPHLYSTVNQNQIHLHLHGEKAAESLQYGGEELANIVANSSNLTISSGGRSNIEIGIVHNPSGSMTDESLDRFPNPLSERQTDVWRPY